MKYQKFLALMIVVLAVTLSVPGCGKKKSSSSGLGGGPGAVANTVNGFGYSGGMGQSNILSASSCYNIVRAGDGSIQFPIATQPSQPHYIYGAGQLYATAYVAGTAYSGGNHYSVQNSQGDRIDVYISSDDQYFSGVAYLSPQTVKSIQLYLGKTADYNQLCVDGIIFRPAYITAGNKLSSGGYCSASNGIVLFSNDYPVLCF